jgi:ABC-type cobalamin/Fe3+-siderophores transport system ATPase subunit
MDATRYAVIAGRDLTKHYRMGEVDVMALRGVNIELHEGELMVLLGPSGSGKSTLLNILGGLDVCTAGRVMYRDEDLTSADEVVRALDVQSVRRVLHVSDPVGSGSRRSWSRSRSRSAWLPRSRARSARSAASRGCHRPRRCDRPRRCRTGGRWSSACPTRAISTG